MMEYLTPEDIASMLKISYEKALDFIKFSEVNYVKVGRQYRVEEKALLNFLNKYGQYGIRINP